MPVIFRSYIIVSSFVLITLIVVGIKSNFVYIKNQFFSCLLTQFYISVLEYRLIYKKALN